MNTATSLFTHYSLICTSAVLGYKLLLNLIRLYHAHYYCLVIGVTRSTSAINGGNWSEMSSELRSVVAYPSVVLQGA